MTVQFPIKLWPVIAVLLLSPNISGADVDAKTRKRIDECVHAFWKSFVLEDIEAMKNVANGSVVSDIQKGLRIRESLEKVQHVKSDRPTLSEKDVPDIEIVSVKESKIMSFVWRITEIDTYEVAFTAKEMSGTIHVSRDDKPMVESFNGK
jgi:hypothetical protein